MSGYSVSLDDYAEAIKKITDLEQHIKELERERDEAHGKVERLVGHLLYLSTWRADAYDYDEDMGHEARDFLDGEEWNRMEESALAAAKRETPIVTSAMPAARAAAKEER